MLTELATTDHAKFGNGIHQKGEKEAVRIWLELYAMKMRGGVFYLSMACRRAMRGCGPNTGTMKC